MRSTDLFIKDVKKIARANDITVKLPKTNLVYYANDPNPCSGYFHSEDKLLVVGTGKIKRSWLSIMVHESCHMDQFIDDQFLWEKCSPAYNVFFDWLEDHSIMLKRNVLEESVQDIIRLELDCDRRALKKIKEYNLPINIDWYVKCVNIYLYSYLYMMEVRTWLPKIYDYPKCIEVASTKFRSSYTRIPKRLERAFKSIYSNA